MSDIDHRMGVQIRKSLQEKRHANLSFHSGGPRSGACGRVLMPYHSELDLSRRHHKFKEERILETDKKAPELSSLFGPQRVFTSSRKSFSGKFALYKETSHLVARKPRVYRAAN